MEGPGRHVPDGRIISSMNQMLKNNSGYDLKQLFIGTEGTLGIVTKAILRLREKPKSSNTALAAFNSFKAVTIPKLSKTTGNKSCDIRLVSSIVW